MKIFKILALSLVASFAVTSCAKIPEYSNVTATDTGVKGTVKLTTQASAAKAGAAIVEAKAKAIETVLFQGLPGTKFVRPLVPNITNAKNTHSAYFDKLLKTDYMNQFIESSTIRSSKCGFGCKTAKGDIILKYDALRVDLENNKVIPKFAL